MINIAWSVVRALFGARRLCSIHLQWSLSIVGCVKSIRALCVRSGMPFVDSSDHLLGGLLFSSRLVTVRE